MTGPFKRRFRQDACVRGFKHSHGAVTGEQCIMACPCTLYTQGGTHAPATHEGGGMGDDLLGPLWGIALRPARRLVVEQTRADPESGCEHL